MSKSPLSLGIYAQVYRNITIRLNPRFKRHIHPFVIFVNRICNKIQRIQCSGKFLAYRKVIEFEIALIDGQPVDLVITLEEIFAQAPLCNRAILRIRLNLPGSAFAAEMLVRFFQTSFAGYPGNRIAHILKTDGSSETESKIYL